MANLVVDVGNTFCKIAVFEKNKRVYTSRSAELNKDDVIGLIEKYKISDLILSSVREVPDFNYQEDYPSLNYLLFDHNTRIPVKNNYATPETLGLDRLAAVIGAKEIFSEDPVLVIDAGTCITFDFIDEKSVYEGGAISPGIKMRLKAMHQFTGKLPEINVEQENVDDAIYGKNTVDAMLAGVLKGMAFEIEGYIRHFTNKYSSLKIILCGGDASFFDTRLKNSIFAHQILLEPLLVLTGLNTVVNYQND